MKKAIWIIAHGSSKSEWVEMLENQISKVRSAYPVFLSFLEKVEGRLIPNGIEQLKKHDISDVLVIPLFVSSGSTHIEEIIEILSTYRDIFNFTITNPMDDHDLVVKHIAVQAAMLSNNPKNESLFLIGHGSDKKDFELKWNNMLNKLKFKLEKATNYSQINTATFLPNNIKSQLENAQVANLTSIVIPLFLSNGIFTKKRIPKAIDGYKVKYTGESYLIADWIPDWIESQIISF